MTNPTLPKSLLTQKVNQTPRDKLDEDLELINKWLAYSKLLLIRGSQHLLLKILMWPEQ